MINKIITWIAGIEKDKILHYIVSYIIFDFIFSLCKQLNCINWLSILIAFVVTSVAIFGKELKDEIDYHGWNWHDIIADYLGVVTKIIILLIAIL